MDSNQKKETKINIKDKTKNLFKNPTKFIIPTFIVSLLCLIFSIGTLTNSFYHKPFKNHNNKITEFKNNTKRKQKSFINNAENDKSLKRPKDSSDNNQNNIPFKKQKNSSNSNNSKIPNFNNRQKFDDNQNKNNEENNLPNKQFKQKPNFSQPNPMQKENDNTIRNNYY